MTAVASRSGLDAVVDACLAAAGERGVDVCIAIVDLAGDPQRLYRTASAAPLSGIAALSVAYSTVVGARQAVPIQSDAARIPTATRALGLFPLVESKGGAPLRSGAAVVAAVGVVCNDEDIAQEVADAGASIHLALSLDG